MGRWIGLAAVIATGFNLWRRGLLPFVTRVGLPLSMLGMNLTSWSATRGASLYVLWMGLALSVGGCFIPRQLHDETEADRDGASHQTRNPP